MSHPAYQADTDGRQIISPEDLPLICVFDTTLDHRSLDVFLFCRIDMQYSAPEKIASQRSANKKAVVYSATKALDPLRFSNLVVCRRWLSCARRQA